MMDTITLDQIRTAIREEVRPVIQEELRKEQKGLYKLLESLASDVSQLKGDVSRLTKAVEIIARRFINLDKLSEQTSKQLEELLAD